MIDNSTKIAVYTAIYRSDELCDRLHSPEFIDKNFDYFCFTPHDELKADWWKIIPTIWEKNVSPRMQAKFYKIFPHRFLQKYDYSIWLDGNFSIKSNLRELLIKTMKTKGDKPFIFFSNYQSNCVYDSAEYCITHHIGNREKIHKQMERYYQEGLPQNYGLPMCGMLFRQHTDISVQMVMNLWWEEIKTHSERDQLSLPYVLWKLDSKNYIAIKNTKKRLWNAFFRAHSRKKRYHES